MTLPAQLVEQLLFVAIRSSEELAICALNDLLEEHGLARTAEQTVLAAKRCRYWRSYCLPMRISVLLLRAWADEHPLEPTQLVAGLWAAGKRARKYVLLAPLGHSRAMAKIATHWLATGDAPPDFAESAEIVARLQLGAACSGEDSISLDDALAVTPSKESVNYLRCWPSTIVM